MGADYGSDHEWNAIGARHMVTIKDLNRADIATTLRYDTSFQRGESEYLKSRMGRYDVPYRLCWRSIPIAIIRVVRRYDYRVIIDRVLPPVDQSIRWLREMRQYSPCNPHNAKHRSRVAEFYDHITIQKLQ